MVRTGVLICLIVSLFVITICKYEHLLYLVVFSLDRPGVLCPLMSPKDMPISASWNVEDLLSKICLIVL